MFCKLILCCVVLATFIDKCQPDRLIETRLSGGQDVDSLRQFPHHVYIIPVKSQRQCGGSILNAQWILTSAACIKDSDRMELHFGKKNLNAADYFTCSVNSDQVYVYPTNFDDLALIRLPMMLIFSDTIMPINISRMSIEQLRNRFVVMPGFNEHEKETTRMMTITTPRTTAARASSTSTSTPRTTKDTPTPARKQRSLNKRADGEKDDNLKYGMFNIVDNTNCEKLLGSKFDEYRQICTEGWGKNSNSPCDSDYGSGLVIGWPAKSELAAMFSMYSTVCDEKMPAVFTYVAKYLPWIDSMIQG